MNKERIKNIMKKVFFLPPALTLVISVPAFLLVIFTLSDGTEKSVISYISYLLSSYALVITITGIVRTIKWFRNRPFIKKLLDLPVLKKFFHEVEFRTEISLYQGLTINLLYTGIKFFSGVYYRSVWFIALSVYYLLLAVMRISLISFVRKRGNTVRNVDLEWRRYRLCGIILLFMDQALVGIITLVVHQNSGFEYPGTLIYVMAFYTFYSAVTAVINVVKFRKYGTPILSSAKVISLTAALVSMLSLETAMLTQFGAADDPMFRQIMTASTGAAISIIVLGMAVFMIARSTKRLKHTRS